MTETINIKIVFSGGLELLFNNQSDLSVSIPQFVPSSSTPSSSHDVSPSTPETKAVDIEYLIYHLRDHVLKERPELFMENQSIRPGILVLINNTDWELEGEASYQLCDNDEIVFISTLHGG